MNSNNGSTQGKGKSKREAADIEDFLGSSPAEKAIAMISMAPKEGANFLLVMFYPPAGGTAAEPADINLAIRTDLPNSALREKVYNAAAKAIAKTLRKYDPSKTVRWWPDDIQGEVQLKKVPRVEEDDTALKTLGRVLQMPNTTLFKERADDAQRGWDEHFGVCPKCRRSDGYINIGRDHWFFCKKHKVRWNVGSNLFSSWKHQTEDDQRRQYDELKFGEFTDITYAEQPVEKLAHEICTSCFQLTQICTPGTLSNESLYLLSRAAGCLSALLKGMELTCRVKTNSQFIEETHGGVQ